MPKVKHYSASWLSNNAPGHQLFEAPQETLRSRAASPPYSSKKKQPLGPKRTIAHRGTEVFVAVGKEIRWGDLAYLKEEWSVAQTKARRGSATRIKRESSVQPIEDSAELSGAQGFRVSRGCCLQQQNRKG